MIAAVFDGRNDRSGAVSGAYQYDTGQRLAMHGLPSPQELAGKDDLLSGDLVTVQAQFSYKGDSQTDMRLAMWDEERKIWLVDVPDEYLTRHRDVHMYVYCYYGSDETGERAETAYEASFRPVSRPAPAGTVTQDQLEQWANLKAEIEISLAKVGNAAGGANDAAREADEAGERAAGDMQSAHAAAQAAKDAADALREAGEKVGQADGTTAKIAAGAQATAALGLQEKIGRLTLGAPQGANGRKGETGDTGPSDVTFAFDEETGTLTMTTAEHTGEE